MWSHRHKIRKTRGHAPQRAPKRRVNRHSEEHHDKVRSQVSRLVTQERAYRDHWATDIDGEGARRLVARGVRQPGESDFAVAVCNTYLRLGPRRSLTKALQRWQWDYDHGLVARVPTLNTLKSWSRRFEWQARAYLCDYVSHGEVARRTLQAEELQQRERQESKARE